MSIIDEALQLPKEEKVKLYYALQSDLQYDDSVVNEDELSAEQWSELMRREKNIEEGNKNIISESDLQSLLKKRRDAL